MKILREIIEEACEEESFLDDERCTLEKLTVLKIGADPYRCDTPAIRRDAEWVAAQVARFSPKKQIHLRGLHYQVVAAGNIDMPNGKRYVNTEECYAFMNEAAAQARWLGLVRFFHIVDNRNDPPWIPEEQPGYEPPGEVPIAELERGHEVWVPDTDTLLPRFRLRGGFTARQPYRLVMFGEKSSLREDLLPLAKEFGTELIIASGENSLTLIYDMLKRATKDGRPLRCFYFSDFDPGGVQMPVSTARKIQGMRDQFYPDLDLRLYKVALTEDQVIRLKLPDTPLKDKDKRAPSWRRRFRREATEIDALTALHPGELERIAREALVAFFDADLKSSVEDAERDWRDEAAEAIEEHPEYDTIRELIDEAREGVVKAVEQLETAQQTALDTLSDLEPPEIVIPEPDVEEEDDDDDPDLCPPSLVFNTKMGFAAASRRLLAIKKYEE